MSPQPLKSDNWAFVAVRALADGETDGKWSKAETNQEGNEGKSTFKGFLTPVKHEKDSSVYPVQSPSRMGTYLHIPALKNVLFYILLENRKFLIFLICKLHPL